MRELNIEETDNRDVNTTIVHLETGDVVEIDPIEFMENVIECNSQDEEMEENLLNLLKEIKTTLNSWGDFTSPMVMFLES
jgi:hypothetical protein